MEPWSLSILLLRLVVRESEREIVDLSLFLFEFGARYFILFLFFRLFLLEFGGYTLKILTLWQSKQLSSLIVSGY